ncbi:MAG: glycosyltransferase family 2 protein [Hyphomonadaceae bacterium]
MSARIAAVIVVYHPGVILKECIAAAQADGEIEEIVLVDNGSDAAEAALMRYAAGEDARIAIVSGQGNIGFAAGCNLGAARTKGAQLLFLNPDVVIDTGAAGRLSQTADSAARRPCIVGGVLTDAGGREDRGCRRARVTPWRAFVSFSGLEALGLKSAHRHREPMPNAAVETGAVSGAMMLLPRADFEALGGFDEGYFLHVEDIDLCRRAEAAGGIVLFEPRARGRHARSTSAAPRAFVERHKARGFARYFRKFARGPMERAGAALIGLALIVILPLRAHLRPGSEG